MYVIDRYVLRLFVKVLLVCFVSLAGLYIVIDTFNNLEEFLEYGKTEGGLLSVLCSYYGARVLTFFDWTSPLLTMIAAIFVITLLQKSNELTALLAAGIPQRRIIRPLIIAAILVSVLAVANREFLIPSVRDKLANNAQNWLGDKERPVNPQWDHRTKIFLGGGSTVAGERRIVQPSFQLFTPLGDFHRQITAEDAVYQPPTGTRPGGYLLSNVKSPKDISSFPSAYLDNAKTQPVILSCSDTPWLEPGQCFVVSDVDFQQLSNGSKWQRHASSWELMKAFRNPSLAYGATSRVVIHARLVQPLLDLTLLFLALPLVLTRHNRSIFVAAGWCLLVVAGFFLIKIASHGLGTYGLLSPHLAAWVPLIIFAPLALAMSKNLQN